MSATTNDEGREWTATVHLGKRRLASMTGDCMECRQPIGDDDVAHSVSFYAGQGRFLNGMVCERCGRYWTDVVRVADAAPAAGAGREGE